MCYITGKDKNICIDHHIAFVDGRFLITDSSGNILHLAHIETLPALEYNDVSDLERLCTIVKSNKVQA